jgi:predicted lipid-binding transport protein (Tim44 family)
MMDSPPDDRELQDRPVGQLLRELSEQTTRLVRQELELAKAEVAEKGKRAGIGGGLFGGAGVAGLLALGALTACIIAALSTAMGVWLAALIVSVVYAVIAGVLALAGRSRIKQATPPAPEQTIETVKEDVQWAKTRARSGRT